METREEVMLELIVDLCALRLPVDKREVPPRRVHVHGDYDNHRFCEDAACSPARSWKLAADMSPAATARAALAVEAELLAASLEGKPL